MSEFTGDTELLHLTLASIAEARRWDSFCTYSCYREEIDNDPPQNRGICCRGFHVDFDATFNPILSVEVMRLHQHTIKNIRHYLYGMEKYWIVAKDNLRATNTNTKDTSCYNLEKDTGGGG